MSRVAWASSFGWACVAGVVGGLSGVARGEDAPTVDLAPREAWQAGDVVTWTLQSAMDVEDVQSGPGYPARRGGGRFAVDATWVERCEQAGPDGTATTSRIAFTSWTLTAGTQKDTSVAGRTLVATRGKGSSYRLEGEGAVSPVAKGWLDRAFGAGAKGDWLPALLPKGSVAVGAAWDADLLRLVSVLLHENSGVDPARSEGKVTLESAGPPAKVRWSLKAQTVNMPSGPMKEPWTKGGVLAFEGEANVEPGARLPETSAKALGTLEGERLLKEDEEADARLVRTLKVRVEIQTSRKRGGEMPAPK